VIAGEVAACRRCVELSWSGTTPVHCAGGTTARICFLFKVPGADETPAASLFVGRVGHLSHEDIEACRLTG
jgi:Uracil-DNA glycosylase